MIKKSLLGDRSLRATILLTAAVWLYVAWRVFAVTVVWIKIADEVQRADIRVCANMLPPGLQSDFQHQSSLKPIPEPDAQPCAEGMNGYAEGTVKQTDSFFKAHRRFHDERERR